MTPPSPELAELIAGYCRFRENRWKPERERWATLREGQQPRVMIIACSDSRVDPAQIFDVHPGEIFVVRNVRSEEHTSELQSLMRISYAVFCLKKKKHTNHHTKRTS